MSLFQCSKPRAVSWMAMTFPGLAGCNRAHRLSGTDWNLSPRVLGCRWVTLEPVVEKAPAFDPVYHKLQCLESCYQVFLNNAPRKLGGVFFFTLSHHYTEEISPIESTASISKSGDCASEVAWSMRARWEVGGVQKAGWPGGSVHGKEKVLLFVYLYCIIGATISPFVCICIDFLVYDIFPCEDLFIFFSMLN